MNKIIAQIESIKIVPVVKIDEPKKAIPLAKALIDGGIPCAEITFRTAAAEEAISLVSAEFPEMLVGAGTVLTTEQADKAKAAGAKFAVSPGFNPKVVDHCLKIGLPIFPGCCTPSEMEQAIERDLKVVKFFPAEQAGGLAFIKAVSAPYSDLRFMPTGGINPENINQYLGFNKIIACGGSWMVNSILIENDDFDEITRLCKETLSKIS